MLVVASSSLLTLYMLFGTEGKIQLRAFKSYTAPQGAAINVYYFKGSTPNCFDTCDSASFTISVNTPLKISEFKEVIDKTIGQDFTHFKTVQRYDTADYFVNNSAECVVPEYITEEYPGKIAVGDPCSKLQVYYKLIYGIVYQPASKKIRGCEALSGTLVAESFDKNGFESATFKKVKMSCKKTMPEKVFTFFKNS